MDMIFLSFYEGLSNEKDLPEKKIDDLISIFKENHEKEP